MTRTFEHTAVELGPKSLTQRQTALVILRAAGRAVLAGGTGCGCRRAHPRARTGRAAPSRTALRSVGARGHLLVLVRLPRTDGTCCSPSGEPGGRPAMTALAPTLQAFFTEQMSERGASPHTIAAYRDTFRLLLGFA